MCMHMSQQKTSSIMMQYLADMEMSMLSMTHSTSAGGCGLLWAVLAYRWLIRKQPSLSTPVSSKLASTMDQNSNINAATPVPWLKLFRNYSFWSVFTQAFLLSMCIRFKSLILLWALWLMERLPMQHLSSCPLLYGTMRSVLSLCMSYLLFTLPAPQN